MYHLGKVFIEGFIGGGSRLPPCVAPTIDGRGSLSPSGIDHYSSNGIRPVDGQITAPPPPPISIPDALSAH